MHRFVTVEDLQALLGGPLPKEEVDAVFGEPPQPAEGGGGGGEGGKSSPSLDFAGDCGFVHGSFCAKMAS